MTIRHVDVLLYGGGECFQKFGVAFMGVTKSQRVAPTFTRSDSVSRFFDRNGISRPSSANRMRVEWDDDVPYIMNEQSRVNVVLHNRNLTNAAWTKTNVTAAKDQTGIDGVANSASKITASAGNGTCLQAITLASSARFQSCYIKRVTGSGTIEMTMDNGSTWTEVTVTSDWTRVTIPTQTLANPTVGFRIVTSGDAVAIDFVQNENGTYPTSPVETTTAAVTRQAETTFVTYPHVPQEHAGYVRFTEGMAPTWDAERRVLEIADASDSAPALVIYRTSGADSYTLLWHASSAFVTSAIDLNPSRGDDIELFWWQYDDGSVQLAGRKNSGSVTTGTRSTEITFGTSYSAKRFYLSHPSAPGAALYRAVKMVRGSSHSTDDLASLFAWVAT